ncbi:unnamed protein product [Prorocentrum cordatum]|uniref:Myosin motor domain-containing protein n=1 Tax=Prorocentrum cordatum TaxID=2364126 RepID=A0ABN9R337_9DINO|nr:unnamed protein product [Polarella glacialis]
MDVIGSRVWILEHPTEGWLPGRVDSVDGGQLLVVDDEGGQFEIQQDQARPVDEACLQGVPDLLSLGDYNEGALLHNVRVRYLRDEIYTCIGEPILISVNPFKSILGLYSEEQMSHYRKRKGQDSPHLFSVADASFRAMLNDGRSQSIVITGESGAGKTEATKRILAYFANLQQSPSKAGGSLLSMSIEDQVLRSNPILEAFGNAKTVRNDNSSRFGKFISINFDAGGKLQSSRISNYLLEKSRIVTQQPEERGYHAFYQILRGAGGLGLEPPLALGEPGDHAYTSTCTDVPGVNDAADFHEMWECMAGLGFTTEERDSVIHIAAAVLHMGDLEFGELAPQEEGCRVLNLGKVTTICDLLSIEVGAFVKVFQFKTLQDPFTKKVIERPQDPTHASSTRHTMAKVAYSRLFDWLVWRINKSTASKVSTEKMRQISILDIYGFEVFEWNSFEQLCINFANEKLQQHFNSHMFTLEQQLYTEEGISWSHIQWVDNRHIIDALEKKPLGVFCIIDSECLMPNSTDETCLNKVYNSSKNSTIVFKPTRFASSDFAVAHYAGQVIYDIRGFLEKNTDKLHSDVTGILRSSKQALLSTLFTDPLFAPERAPPPAPGAGGRDASPRTPRGTTPTRSLTPTRRASMQRTLTGGDRQKQNVTVSMMFRGQLEQLVDDLNMTNPRYIRCIKPNTNKVELEFDSLDVQRQLRCAGMLESIRIRRAGYSVRRPFKEFFLRFRILCPRINQGREPDWKDLCQKLLVEIEARNEAENWHLEARSWQVGRTRVFMREMMHQLLESEVAKATKVFVVRIQGAWRRHFCLRRYLATLRAGRIVQAALRTLTPVAKLAAARAAMGEKERQEREAALAREREAAEAALAREHREREAARLAAEAERQDSERLQQERQQAAERDSREVPALREENAALRDEVAALRRELENAMEQLEKAKRERSGGQFSNEELFVADNSQLEADTPGLAWLKSQNVADSAIGSQTLLWGSGVAGSVTPDGQFLFSGGLFLPMRVDGVAVLVREEHNKLRLEHEALRARHSSLLRKMQRFSDVIKPEALGSLLRKRPG